MAFLSSILGYVVTAALSALGGWLLKMLHTWQQSQQNVSDAKQSVEPLKQADPKDGDAIDKAADDTLSGF